MTERPIPLFARMKTDERGWPLIRFVPEGESLSAVAAFLQDDVDVLLPVCDELLHAIDSVLAGREEERVWNGNRFLVRLSRDRALLTDKYGAAVTGSAPVAIETALLATIVAGWKEFVSELPRQRELASAEP